LEIAFDQQGHDQHLIGATGRLRGLQSHLADAGVHDSATRVLPLAMPPVRPIRKTSRAVSAIVVN
jgi:hypothetical protein